VADPGSTVCVTLESAWLSSYPAQVSKTTLKGRLVSRLPHIDELPAITGAYRGSARPIPPPGAAPRGVPQCASGRCPALRLPAHADGLRWVGQAADRKRGAARCPRTDVETYHENGQWKSKVEGSSRVANAHSRKTDARLKSRDMARDRHVEHIIRRMDGTIGERNSYANDPRNIPG
jgi:hypothetical protein